MEFQEIMDKTAENRDAILQALIEPITDFQLLNFKILQLKENPHPSPSTQAQLIETLVREKVKLERDIISIIDI